MTFLTSLLLICAIGSSLALGVLLAYALCHMMFTAFRVHSIKAAEARVAPATVRAIAGS